MMDIKDLANDKLAKIGGAVAIAKVIQSFLGKHAKAGYAQKIAKVPAKAIAKKLIYIELANAGSAKLKEVLPHVDSGFTWVTALPYNILNQTLGRIPGVGDVFRTIHNWITDTVSKGAKAIGWDALADTGSALRLTDPNNGFETEIDWQTGKVINTPLQNEENQEGKKDENNMPKSKTGKAQETNDAIFYDNLGMHKEFRLPGGYPKSLTAVSEEVHVPTVVVHKLIQNPNPDATATIDRMNQLFTLIKAVRGLSQVGYTTTDLFNFVQYSKLLVLFYFNIKRAVRAAKTYSLVNNGIGKHIVSACGLNYDDVCDNLAVYESALCQIHNFISNNIPMSGHWIKKYEFLHSGFMPDYKDGQLATIHMFNVKISAFYAPNTDADESFYTPLTSGTGASYAFMMGKFRSFVQHFQSNDKWAQITADYFGAFGGKAIWSDPDFPSYSKPLSFDRFKEMELDQIKNAIYIGARCAYSDSVNTVTRYINVESASAVSLPTEYIHGVSTPATADFIARTYDDALNKASFIKVTGSNSISASSNANVQLPKMAGFDANYIDNQSDKAAINKGADFSLNRTKLSEAESIELMQFKASGIVRTETKISGANQVVVTQYFYTNDMAMVDSIAYYPTSAANYSYVYIMPCIYDLRATEAALATPPFDGDMYAVWSLIDWMPRLKTTFVGNDDAGQPIYKFVDLWDIDNFGAINAASLQTCVAYTTFSLMGANLAITETKRVNNLNEVYKPKGSSKV